jgi:hypothetical protein
VNFIAYLLVIAGRGTAIFAGSWARELNSKVFEMVILYKFLVKILYLLNSP